MNHGDTEARRPLGIFSEALAEAATGDRDSSVTLCLRGGCSR